MPEQGGRNGPWESQQQWPQPVAFLRFIPEKRCADIRSSLPQAYLLQLLPGLGAKGAVRLRDRLKLFQEGSLGPHAFQVHTSDADQDDSRSGTQCCPGSVSEQHIKALHGLQIGVLMPDWRPVMSEAENLHTALYVISMTLAFAVCSSSPR